MNTKVSSEAAPTIKPKALGPIPSGFEAIGKELAIGGKTASALVQEAGRTPLFVY